MNNGGRATEEIIQDLAATVDRLEARIEDLEAENETYRAHIELRPFEDEDGQVTDPTEGDTPKLGNIWIAGLPVGRLLRSTKQQKDELFDRILALEGGVENADEMASVQSTHLLPIQLKLRDRRAGATVRPNNALRATFVWEAFRTSAKEGADSNLLGFTKEQVKKTLIDNADNLDGSESLLTNPVTVSRVMEQLAKHTHPEIPPDSKDADPESEENLLTCMERAGTRMLVARQNEWDEWVDRLRQDLRDDATPGDDLENTTEEVAFEGEPVTTDMEDPVKSRFEM